MKVTMGDAKYNVQYDITVNDMKLMGKKESKRRVLNRNQVTTF